MTRPALVCRQAGGSLTMESPVVVHEPHVQGAPGGPWPSERKKRRFVGECCDQGLGPVL